MLLWAIWCSKCAILTLCSCLSSWFEAAYRMLILLVPCFSSLAIFFWSFLIFALFLFTVMLLWAIWCSKCAILTLCSCLSSWFEAAYRMLILTLPLKLVAISVVILSSQFGLITWRDVNSFSSKSFTKSRMTVLKIISKVDLDVAKLYTTVAYKASEVMLSNEQPPINTRKLFIDTPCFETPQTNLRPLHMSHTRYTSANTVKKIQPTEVKSDVFWQSKLFWGHEKAYIQILSSPKSNDAASMKKVKHRACVAKTARASTHAVTLLLKKKLYAESLPIEWSSFCIGGGFWFWLQMKSYAALLKAVNTANKTIEPIKNEAIWPKSACDSLASHSWRELQHIVQSGQSSGESNSEGLPQSVMKLDLVCPFNARRGTVPCNRLLWRWSSSNLGKLAISGGTVPVILLKLKIKDFKFERFPISFGMLPLISLSRRSIISRPAKLPITSGIRPDKPPFLSVKLITWPSSLHTTPCHWQWLLNSSTQPAEFVHSCPLAS